jgi:hypothetical protein
MRADELAALLSNVTGAASCRYGVCDEDGRPLEGLKIHQAGPGRYLGVSHAQEHGRFHVHLSVSRELLEWTAVRRLDEDASQPTLEPDGRGGWFVADELMRSRKGNALRFLWFSSTEALLEGRPDRRFEPRNTLARRGAAQGTPHLFTIRLEPDLDRSTIGVGFHYFDGTRDLQAEGELRDFAHWTAAARPDLDALFPRARGNIGDRDAFPVGDATYVIHEAQGAVGDWGSWRVYLRDPRDQTVVPLSVRTRGGSVSFGNPTVTPIALPNGRPGLVTTLFVFGPGSAPGERGSLVYTLELPDAENDVVGPQGFEP